MVFVNFDNNTAGPKCVANITAKVEMAAKGERAAPEDKNAFNALEACKAKAGGRYLDVDLKYERTRGNQVKGAAPAPVGFTL